MSARVPRRPLLGRSTRFQIAAIALSASTAVFGAEQFAGLGDLSLEQLREVVVTTVSLRAEGLDRTAASVYVISADAIRRSGATTIPEALRLAPTLTVARADANQYAISARGFNNVLANKLLVVIDGRAVYSPLFSGVFWEAQDVLLEDVDRIEVVTGPSTALWGSNAVNALIHIVTKNAAATQGGSAALRAGNGERGASIRFGGAVDRVGHYRLYGKTFKRNSTELTNGADTGDASVGSQIGFRGDWVRESDSIAFQGDTYESTIDQGPSSTRKISGANLLGRWDRSLAGGANLRLQAYVDQTKRDQAPTIIEKLTTSDLIAQYSFKPLDDHRALVGLGYRSSRDRLTNFTSLAFIPATRTLEWARVFGQDEVSLTPDLTASLSASVETNPFTAAQFLPSLRLSYALGPDHTLWASASRAARAPSRVDREFFQPAQPPHIVAGGPDFTSEISKVYSLGYRAQPIPALTYSVTAFYQQHDGLRSLGPTAQGLQFQNGLEGTSRGAEGWIAWQVADSWRLDGGFTLLRQRFSVSPGAIDVGGTASLGNDPRHTWTLRSSWDITPRLSWDVAVRHVAALPSPAVPAYTATDMRWAWTLSPDVDLTLSLKNVLDPSHPEWGVATNRVEHERSVLLQLLYRF